MSFNPLQWDYQIWRWFFTAASVWNLVGAAEGLARPGLSLRRFYGVEPDDFHTLFLCRSFWGAVLVFGIGYALVAYSPAAYPGIVVMGIMGKTVVSVGWFYLRAAGRARNVAALAATGDSLFTVFFVIYLLGGARGAGVP